MVEIPEALRRKEFRFIKIREGTKRPAEQNWQVDWNYQYDDSKFQEYLKNASVYGILCGAGNLAVVDCDNASLVHIVEKELPPTFTVKTGSGGRHYYYIIKDMNKKLILKKGTKHYGEIQYTGSQVLGANSKHPNGNIYEIINDIPIAEISIVDIRRAFKGYLQDLQENVEKTEYDLDISKVAYTIKSLDKYGETALQGSHPIHGSTNGMNFRIDLDKNLWHCFRCGSGGDTLSLIALLEGLAECHELKRGFFKEHPNIFFETLRIAKDKYGYNVRLVDKEKKLGKKLGKSEEKVDIQTVTQRIIENNQFFVLAGKALASSVIAWYRDGYFQKHLGVVYLREAIQKELGDAWTPSKEGDVFAELLGKSEVWYPKKVVQLSLNPNLINFNNGVLDIETMTLRPHNPSYQFFYKIPHNFNSNASCPKILKFIEDVIEPEFIPFIQEMVGYMFYTRMIFPAIFYLYGSGGNGKTVFAKILTETLGEELVSNRTITSLATNRFAPHSLYGKLLNITTEEDDFDKINTSILKALSSGDTITIENKGEHAFSYSSVAKLVSACNRIPVCKDNSNAWLQRQYVIPFLKVFRGTEKENPFLVDELTSEEELEGFIAWAIKGLKRLLKNKKFSYPYDNKSYYEKAVYSIPIFFEQTYVSVMDISLEIPIKEIYEDLCSWLKKNKLPTVTYNALVGWMKSKKLKLIYNEKEYVLLGYKKVI